MNGMFDERYEKMMSLAFERDDWRRRAETAEKQLNLMRKELDDLKQSLPSAQPVEA